MHAPVLLALIILPYMPLNISTYAYRLPKALTAELHTQFSSLHLSYEKPDLALLSYGFTWCFHMYDSTEKGTDTMSTLLQSTAPICMLCCQEPLSIRRRKPILYERLFARKRFGRWFHGLQRWLLAFSVGKWADFFWRPHFLYTIERAALNKYLAGLGEQRYACMATPHPQTFHVPAFLWDAFAKEPYWAHLQHPPAVVSAAQRKFCCFYFPELCDPEAVRVYNYLSCYRKIDCYGHPLLATDNFSQAPSLEELYALYQQYKFVLCVEVAHERGFISRQLPLALAAGAVPLYKGAPDVSDYFHAARFVDYDAVGGTLPAFRDELKRLDKDPSAYETMRTAAVFTETHKKNMQTIKTGFNAFMTTFCNQIQAIKQKHIPKTLLS